MIDTLIEMSLIIGIAIGAAGYHYSSKYRAKLKAAWVSIWSKKP